MSTVGARSPFVYRQPSTSAGGGEGTQIIDKGILSTGLLAQVIGAKHDDHLPHQAVSAAQGPRIQDSFGPVTVATFELVSTPL